MVPGLRRQYMNPAFSCAAALEFLVGDEGRVEREKQLRCAGKHEMKFSHAVAMQIGSGVSSSEGG
jgi:hypothetical protein